MELDDLKQSWDEETKQEFKTSDSNFMEQLHNKSYGPVATLKNKFGLQLIKFPLTVVVIIYVFIKRPELLNNIFMWILIAIVLVSTAFYWFNYTIVSQLQNANSSVKKSIEQNLQTLENGFKKYLSFSRIVFVFFVILVEVLMHFHKVPDPEIWYSIPIYFRILIYIFCFFLNRFLLKLYFKKKFGQDISFLHELLKKMD